MFSLTFTALYLVQYYSIDSKTHLWISNTKCGLKGRNKARGSLYFFFAKLQFANERRGRAQNGLHLQ